MPSACRHFAGLYVREQIRQRVGEPIVALLRMGASPRRIAISIAVGTIIGILPLLGTTTALCFVIALSLRLNLVAMQAFNWLVAGPQLILIVPFIRLGEKFYRAPPLSVHPDEVREIFATGLLEAVHRLGISIGHAVTGWLLVAPLLFLLAYALSYPILLNIARKRA